MVAERISCEDIKTIGKYGLLKVTLPTYRACVSAKNLVTHVKSMYPREDGLTYSTSIDKSTNTITIKTIERTLVSAKHKKV